jgi:type II secretory pathway predicted ATPase ExeA
VWHKKIREMRNNGGGTEPGAVVERVYSVAVQCLRDLAIRRQQRRWVVLLTMGVGKGVVVVLLYEASLDEATGHSRRSKIDASASMNAKEVSHAAKSRILGSKEGGVQA